MDNKFIAPISIDLGAKHTGVYSSFYKAGTDIGEIEQKGVVYNLEKDKYTLLMLERTQRRHQRRGIDRRQMAKRLLRLIWQEKFQLPWDEETAQTIGFLMNRRGFSFLVDEFNPDVLNNFPAEAWEKLPEELRNLLTEEEKGIETNADGSYQVYSVIQNILESGSDSGKKISELCEHVSKETKRIAKELFYYKKCNDVIKYCEKIEQGNEDKDKKKDERNSLSRWIVKKMVCENGVQGLDSLLEKKKYQLPIREFLRENREAAVSVKESLEKIDFEDKELKKSIWNFRAEQFHDKKEILSSQEVDEKYVSKHLHHLAFALYKINDEIVSGGRHRKKYFEEVKKVLEEKNHTHGYLKRFCEKLQNNSYTPLNIDSFTNLIGNVSNLELKPLRRYFNDPEHGPADYYSEERLRRCFSIWILKNWRVGDDRKEDYSQLCDNWKSREGDVVDFWLESNPILTIPPYQNNNNRRPPRCQSFILNADYMNQHYPQWKSWLDELKNSGVCREYLGDFEGKLNNLKSQRGNAYYFDDGDFTGELVKDSQKLRSEDRDCRIFQIILDRTKAADPFKLNEIYSYVKKLRQDNSPEYWDYLNNVRNESSLPNKLLSDADPETDDIYGRESFLNFVCRYYKMRQRAKDGRIFIHPEYHKGNFRRTRRFKNEDHILRVCNSKPRQKRYQSLYDLASIFQINPEKLEEIVNKEVGEEGDIDSRIQKWLKNFRGLISYCEKSAEAQKDYRGRLNTELNRKDESIDKKLKKLKNNVEGLSCEIAESLNKHLPGSPISAEKFKSVYSFAQIHQIAFSDRNGNAHTCPICSLDNSVRMQMQVLATKKIAKAQRLPAISTRLIDGAVMRSCRILSEHICRDNWQKIKRELKNGNKVSVPIIAELNRFEFEPALREIKSKPKLEMGDFFSSKEERIRKSGKSICPYTGESIGKGEIDHIIPRTSKKYGELNDEANLIYSTQKGNKEIKGEKIYNLSNLKQNYKESIFGKGITDEKIREEIEETIWDSDSKNFKFGRYRSFINLDEHEKKCFRHALFLPEGNQIRRRVISSISNRNRALVNGTQRYMADVLANELYKEAVKINREDLISFDFFGVEVNQNSQGDSINDFRKELEERYKEEYEEIKKKDLQKQKFESHLLDAHIAFYLNSEKHRFPGSMKINFEEENPSDRYRIFHESRSREDYPKSEKNIQRRGPGNKFIQHCSFTRDGFYAMNYKPIIIKKMNDDSQGKICAKIGYKWSCAEEMKLTSKNSGFIHRLLDNKLCTKFKDLPEFQKDTKKHAESLHERLINSMDFSRDASVTYLIIDKKMMHQYFMKEYNTKDCESPDDFFHFCYSTLGYRTGRKKIELAVTNDEIIMPSEKDNSEFPFYSQWIRIDKDWKEYKKRHSDDGDISDIFHVFRRKWFLKNNNELKNRLSHQKVRKTFSLPEKVGEGRFLLQRRAWNDNDIFQVANDSDSRKVGNKAGVLILAQEEKKLVEKLAPWAKSKNFVRLWKGVGDNIQGEAIDPNLWIKIDTTKIKWTYEKGDLTGLIESVWYRCDDNTRPSVAIKLTESGTITEGTKDKIIQHSLFKLREKNTKLKKEYGERIYTGKCAGFSKEIMNLIIDSQIETTVYPE